MNTLVSAALTAALFTPVVLLAAQGGGTPGFTERPVEVTGGPVVLPGTLTIPTSGTGRYPGVIIVHGSGQVDRNMTIGPNAPYRDLAQGLAAQGIVVLRYDKRPTVQPTWFANKIFTVRDEVTDDARHALAILRQQPEVDAARTFVIGHSLGGMLAPSIAQEDGKLAGIVLMAGATRASLPDQFERQLDYIASLEGPSATAAAQQRQALAPLLTALRAITPADSASLVPILGAPPAYHLDLAKREPARLARELALPILVMQGERDYQVTTAQLDDWLAAVGPSERITVKRYPSLNHLFLSGAGPSRPEEYATPGTVPGEVIRDLAEWIGQRKQ